MNPEPNRQTFQIRSAIAEDWPALWPLLRAMDQLDAKSEVRARLEQLLTRDDHLLCVAVTGHNSVIVAYAWALDYGCHLRSGKSTARLHDLYVDPEHRRSGIGARLLVAIASWAVARGVTWLQWQASAQATPFYERLGFAGDPCPDPNHPFYEIDFSQGNWQAKLKH